MRIWIDDIRTPPEEDWTWVKTSQEALDLLAQVVISDVEEISFDHDLGLNVDGGDDTSRRVAYYLCEVDSFPKQVWVHSSNPVGRDYLIGMFDRYGNGAQYRAYVNPNPSGK